MLPYLPRPAFVGHPHHDRTGLASAPSRYRRCVQCRAGPANATTSTAKEFVGRALRCFSSQKWRGCDGVASFSASVAVVTGTGVATRREAGPLSSLRPHGRQRRPLCVRFRFCIGATWIGRPSSDRTGGRDIPLQRSLGLPAWTHGSADAGPIARRQVDLSRRRFPGRVVSVRASKTQAFFALDGAAGGVSCWPC